MPTNIFEEIIIVILMIVLFLLVYAPYFSLTSLNGIESELREIRRLLEKHK